MGEPRKSARVLGAEHGLNAQEMNFLLRNQGILEGAPRRWRPTPKGEKYAHQQHRSHGPNSSYEMPTWDDSIQDELDLSDDEKRQAREDAAQARADRRAEQVDTLDTDSSDVDGGVPERLADAAAQAVVAFWDGQRGWA